MNYIKPLLFILLLSIAPSFALSQESQESFAGLKLEASDGSLVNVEPQKLGITVYEWFNPECPFVNKIYKNSFMAKLQEEYIAKDIKWFVVNSTSKEHKDFIPKEQRETLKAKYNIKNATMVYDPDGILGKKIKAKTTPHVFIYKDGNLVYSGAFDDSPDTDSDPEKASANYVKISLDSILAGTLIEKDKTRPYGCSVKY